MPYPLQGAQPAQPNKGCGDSFRFAKRAGLTPQSKPSFLGDSYAPNRVADGESAHEVRVQEQELAAAEWRDLADASHSEYILEGSHMDHMYGLCVAHAEGRYAGMGWQALPAGFNRDGTVVTYSNDPSPDTLAKGRR